MLISSKGIVIQSTKYGENSLISKVISEEKGLLTLISNRSKNKKNRQANFFQPLSAIHFVCYVSNKSSIYRIKEISFNHKVPQVSENIAVNALRFFLAELLGKLIREEEQNFTLYQFLEKKVVELNHSNAELQNFHVYFLIQLFDHLGVQPDLNSDHLYFDLQEGSSVTSKPSHSDYYEKKQLDLLISLYGVRQKFSKTERTTLLNILINYCNVQIGGLENLKSKAVLEMVFT